MKLNIGTVMVAMLLCSRAVFAAPMSLINATTEVVVYGGEAANGLVPYGGYFRYTDLGATEETTWSIDPLLVFPGGGTSVLSNGATGGFGSPVDSGGGIITSTTVTAGITVTAETELVGSNAKTTFHFSTAESLDGTTFVFYAENDLFSYADDAAAYLGSIVGGDLELFMFDSVDGGLTVRLTGEAGPGSELTLFGAGIWTGWGTSLEGGDLSVLSSDDSNYATLGDLGIALAFSLSGSSASLVVNYDTQPDPPGVPEPQSIGLACLGAIGLILGGRHGKRRLPRATRRKR